MAKPAFDPNKPFQAATKKPEFDPGKPFDKAPTESESTIRGAVSGVVADFDDEITGGLGAVGRVFGVKNLGSAKPFDSSSHYEMTSTPLSVDEVVNAYRENRDAAREEKKLDIAINPKSYLGGTLAGALISPVGKLKATEGASALKTAMKTAAMQGAAFGAGASDSDLTKGEVGKFLGDTAMGTATAALVPPGLKATGYALGKGSDIVKWTGKKIYSGLTGVSEQTASKYLANPERINAAKSLGEIKDLVDEHVGILRDAVDNGKATEAEAKAALNEIKAQVTKGLSDKKMDAKDALRSAEEMFSGAKERVLSPIKAINPPIDRAADVSLMVGDLKQKVYEQSKKALETLNPNTKVSLSKVYSSIKESIDGLRAAGTDESLAVADRLQAYMARQIEQHGDEVGSREAKKLIQGLDDITQYSPMAGSFDKAKNAAFKGVRSSLDQTLKEGSPEYRAAMESVSRDAGLLSEANTAFGSPEVAVGKLGRLNTPRGAFDRSTLGQLENAVGKQGAITKEADAFANAQRILKDQNALRKIEQSLPEYQALRSAMAEVAKRNPRWNAEQIEKATASKRRDLAEAVSRRVFAEHRLAPFKALTPGSTENKIKSLMRGSDINTKGVMDRLGKESGKDFVQMADDLAVKQSFDKGNTNGSRNTVMGTVVGFMFGGLYGAGIGATIGHQVIDRYGPKVGKLILDGMIKVKKSPRIQTIRSLKLPENIKQEMEREFRVFISKQNQSEVSSASRVADYGNEPSRSPSSLKGESKWIQDGMDKLGLQDQSIASSKKARELLIEASGLPANSKKLQIIKNKIQGLEK